MSSNIITITKPIIPIPSSSLILNKPNQSNNQINDSNTIIHYYFNQYQRLKKQNITLNNQLIIINKQKQQLKNKFNIIKKQHQQKGKRHRRTANQINRNYICPLDDCQRKYGSEGSLLQHIKIKHNTYYNSQQYQQMILSKHKKNKEKLIAYSLNHKMNTKQLQ